MARFRIRPLFAAIALFGASSLLGGCFLAENDEADPLVPQASLAYPMAMGPGRECTLNDEGKPDCKRAEFARRAGGGYAITVWSEAGEGEEEGGSSTDEYRLRALSGPGVPAGTFLVQSASDSEDQRFLGLLKARDRGGWFKISPNCDKLPAPAFVRFMNMDWLRTDDDATLNGLTCHIRREGLDDARLYTILNAPKGDDNPTILFDEG